MLHLLVSNKCIYIYIYIYIITHGIKPDNEGDIRGVRKSPSPVSENFKSVPFLARVTLSTEQYHSQATDASDVTWNPAVFQINF